MLLTVGGLALAACGQTQEPLVAGPTAGLSNDELFAQALTNTRQLRSYHFEMQGEGPGAPGVLSNTLTITADVATRCEALRMHLQYEARGPSAGLFSFVDVKGQDIGRGMDARIIAELGKIKVYTRIASHRVVKIPGLTSGAIWCFFVCVATNQHPKGATKRLTSL